ncbi:MAG: acyltransferase [Bacteroides sp.]|nr:acyltransferase [Bacteroides sp.]MCM1458264.1 acyltransferase [Lachnoclostridium sp.]
MRNLANINRAESKKRIEFIDLAKGVCILQIILIHCGYSFEPAGLRALRMPLYFVLSGMFFKDYGGFISTVWKKTNKLIIPFLFFFLLAHCIVSFDHLMNGTLDSCPSHLSDLIYGGPYFNYPIWFLLCLFWNNVFFLTIYRATNNEILRGILVMLIGLTGLFLIYKSILLPVQLSPALNSLPFFYFGYLLKRTSLLYPSERKSFEWGLIVILLGIGISLSIFFDQPYIFFFNNTIRGNLIIVYITSAAMVIGTLLLCKQIGRLPIISYIGRYSIIPLGVHCILIYYISGIVPTFPQSSLAVFVLTVAISICLTPVFIKYFPYFTAQKDFDINAIRHKTSAIIKPSTNYRS